MSLFLCLCVPPSLLQTLNSMKSKLSKAHAKEHTSSRWHVEACVRWKETLSAYDHSVKKNIWLRKMGDEESEGGAEDDDDGAAALLLKSRFCLHLRAFVLCRHRCEISHWSVQTHESSSASLSHVQDPSVSHQCDQQQINLCESDPAAHRCMDSLPHCVFLGHFHLILFFYTR